MRTSRDGCRRVINLVVCLLTITAFIPPYPLFADEAIGGEFAQLQSEIRAFNERAELHYYQFLNAYENLSRALAKLEAAYASGDESRISAALAEYSAAKQEFQSSVAQAYMLRSEGEELANKTPWLLLNAP